MITKITTKPGQMEWFFWSVCILYCLCWFLLPLMCQNNLRPDSIEQMYIGREWVLSTTKHPTLTAWILETSLILTGRAEWATYLVSQLAVMTVLWCVWKLAKEYLSPQLALLVVVAGMNYRYLNIGSTYFHHSISILPFWAGAVLCFYYALKTEKIRAWCLAGIMLGCGLLCKYPMGILAVTFFLFLVCHSEARKQFKKPGFYLMTLLATLIFLPHFLWLVRHDFPVLDYASYLVDKKGDIINHLILPLKFTAEQLVLLIPVIIPFFPVLGMFWRIESSHWTKSLKDRFLVFVILIPVVIQILIAAVGGGQMRSGLGTHLWLFTGILVVYLFQTNVEPQKIRAGFCLAFLIMAITMLCFAGTLTLGRFFGKTPGRTDFPGKRLAKEVERIWHERYSTPIPYVAGEWVLGGNVAFYGKDRPSVHAFGAADDFDNPRPVTTWSTDEDLDAKGAAVLWTVYDINQPIPNTLTRRFPKAIPVSRVIDIPYQTGADFPPLRVGMAIIPPPKSANVP